MCEEIVNQLLSIYLPTKKKEMPRGKEKEGMKGVTEDRRERKDRERRISEIALTMTGVRKCWEGEMRGESRCQKRKENIFFFLSLCWYNNSYSRDDESNEEEEDADDDVLITPSLRKLLLSMNDITMFIIILIVNIVVVVVVGRKMSDRYRYYTFFPLSFSSEKPKHTFNGGDTSYHNSRIVVKSSLTREGYFFSPRRNYHCMEVAQGTEMIT